MKKLTFVSALLISLSVSALPPRLHVLRMEVAPGKYSKDQNVDFIATMEGNVKVTGNPLLFLNVGPMLRQANYLSGSGTDKIIFRYVVEAEDYDLDGIDDYGMIKGSGSIESIESGRGIETVYPGPHQRKQVFVEARTGNDHE